MERLRSAIDTATRRRACGELSRAGDTATKRRIRQSSERELWAPLSNGLRRAQSSRRGAGGESERGIRSPRFVLRFIAALSLALFATQHISSAQDAEEDSRHDVESIRQSAAEILAGPEYERLNELLESDLAPDEAGSGRGGDSSPEPKSGSPQLKMPQFPLVQVLGNFFVAAAWLCVAAIVGLMIYFVVKAIQSARQDSLSGNEGSTILFQHETEPEHAPGEQPADFYIESARTLATEGRFREAVAQLLLGAMSGIERAGWIRFRRGLTHRDYLRAIRGQEQPYSSLRNLIGTYEPLGFGRRVATAEHYAHSLQNYEAGFRALPEANSH